MFNLKTTHSSNVLVASIFLPIMLSAAPAFAEEPLQQESTFQATLHDAQSIEVPITAAQPTISRDAVTVTSAPQETSSRTPNRYAGAQTYNGGGVVEYARQFIGLVPYVANASDPSVGFDCSGFTKYVFSNALGMNLPHSSTAQGAMGVPISPSQAQPGDLLVWSGHVAIYTGNGMMIDAAVPGTYINERPIWGSPTYIRL